MKKKLLSIMSGIPLEQVELLYSLPLRERLMAMGAFLSYGITILVLFYMSFTEIFSTSLAPAFISLGLLVTSTLIISLIPLFYAPLRRYYRQIAMASIIVGIIIGAVIGGYIGANSGNIEVPVSWQAMLLFYVGLLSSAGTSYFYGKITSALIKERQRIRHDLELASDIQQALLPPLDRRTAFAQVYGRTTPAAEVGGDFCDCIIEEDGSLVLAIGDVSGHGVAAALVAAMLKAGLRAELRHHRNLDDVMRGLNLLLRDNTVKGIFASMQLVRLSSDYRLTVINAGHMPILVSLKGKPCEKLFPRGIALGLMNEWKGNIYSGSVDKNTTLVLFSDGISETVAKKGILEFEEAGIISAIESSAYSNPVELYGKVIAAVDTFSGGAPAADDRTLVVMKV